VFAVAPLAMIDFFIWVASDHIHTSEAFLAHGILASLINDSFLIAWPILGIVVGLGWAFAKYMTHPLETLEDTVKSIGAQGDFTQRVEVTSRREVSGLARAYNMLLDRLQTVNGQMEEACAGVADLASRVMALIVPMGTNVQKQVVDVHIVADASAQISSSVEAVAQNAQWAAGLAQEADGEASRGGLAVKQTAEGMARLASIVEESSEKVASLRQRSDQIGQVTSIIDGIAEQTNLLALNAAIEAARAGEQGRGFAVVADEVRILAERTTDSTKEITKMIQSIQEETTVAVHTIEQGSVEANQAMELARNSGKSLDLIVEVVKQVTDRITQIAAAADSQTKTTHQMDQNIHNVATVSRENEADLGMVTRWVVRLWGYSVAVQWVAARQAGALNTEPEASFSRVALESAFLDHFYHTLIQSHPDMRRLFSKFEKDKQKLILRTEIAALIKFARGDEGSLLILGEIISRHKFIGLSPSMYTNWEESLMASLKEFDPLWSVELESTWRAALAKGLKYCSTCLKMES